MRYRSFGASNHRWLNLAIDSPADDDQPLVHVFRDDELEQLVAAMQDAGTYAAIIHGTEQAEHAAMLAIVRNHGTGA